MLEVAGPRSLVDVAIALARTADAFLGAGSLENARAALVEGRRTRVLRMLLEDLEADADANAEFVSAPGA